MGGLGFLRFAVDVASPDHPTDGEELPSVSVLDRAATPGTLWKIHLPGPLHRKKSGGTGGPITMYLTFLSSAGPRCLTTGSRNQAGAAMTNWLQD